MQEVGCDCESKMFWMCSGGMIKVHIHNLLFFLFLSKSPQYPTCIMPLLSSASLSGLIFVFCHLTVSVPKYPFPIHKATWTGWLPIYYTVKLFMCFLIQWLDYSSIFKPRSCGRLSVPLIFPYLCCTRPLIFMTYACVVQVILLMCLSSYRLPPVVFGILDMEKRTGAKGWKVKLEKQKEL